MYMKSRLGTWNHKQIMRTHKKNEKGSAHHASLCCEYDNLIEWSQLLEQVVYARSLLETPASCKLWRGAQQRN